MSFDVVSLVSRAQTLTATLHCFAAAVLKRKKVYPHFFPNRLVFLRRGTCTLALIFGNGETMNTLLELLSTVVGVYVILVNAWLNCLLRCSSHQQRPHGMYEVLEPRM